MPQRKKENNIHVESPKNSGIYLNIERDQINEVRENSNEEESFGEYGVSTPEKIIMMQLTCQSPVLPFPMEELPMWMGKPAQAYIIPEEQKSSLLKDLYPFSPVPKMEDQMYDLHAEKFFTVKDFKVIRELDRNLLVSPYYAEAGGMVIDWMDDETSTACIRQLKK